VDFGFFPLEALYFYFVTYIDVVKPNVFQSVQQTNLSRLPGKRKNSIELQPIPQDQDKGSDFFGEAERLLKVKFDE
jgi:hypothetical protein